MHPLAVRVLRAIRDQGLAPAGGRLVVALSGGSDSVALTYLLTEVAAEGDVALAGLAHLHHGLRGAAADEDEAFCRGLARALALPIEVERADVRARADAERRSIEDAARAARYAFLERARVKLGADRVASGHTRDDQAETILLRLLRGAGPRGLAGILPQAGVVIRPLLDVSRAELRDYLRARGAAFREDETNLDVRIPRNRIRLEVIPYLQRHLSPAVVDVLARAAVIAGEDAAWLDQIADETARRVVSRRDDRVELDRQVLAGLPRALARRVARRAMSELAPDRFVGFDHVRAVLELAAGAPTSGRLDLPGLRVTREGDTIALVPRPRRRAEPRAVRSDIHYQLPVPGEVEIEELGLAISTELVTRADAAPDRFSPDGDTVAVAAAELSGPLAVRTRRPGDRIRPLGLDGHKKLQDLFVDRKVPREERDRVPLVVDERNRIVWVVGQTIAEDFRVAPGTEAVIILRARRLGGA